jgi:hypothetical protein
MTSKTRVALAFLFAAALASGCDSCKNDPKAAPPPPAADAARPAFSVNISPSAPTSAPMPAGDFKKFFPKENVVFSSTKEGFAEAKLHKDGNEVAILTIVDAEKLAYAKAKFDTATEKLEGFPLLQIGTNQSSVLVKERFQVKVLSQSLDHEARKAILAKFDLKALGGT